MAIRIKVEEDKNLESLALSENYGRIIEKLASSERRTSNLGINDSTASKRLTNLEEFEIVKKEGKFWQLTDKGEKLAHIRKDLIPKEFEDSVKKRMREHIRVKVNKRLLEFARECDHKDEKEAIFERPEVAAEGEYFQEEETVNEIKRKVAIDIGKSPDDEMFSKCFHKNYQEILYSVIESMK